MTVPAALHERFAEVIRCSSCTLATDKNLLRDEYENVPQPGYVGSRYSKARVMLVGQNPGTPKTLGEQDRPYTSALRAIRDDPTSATYSELKAVLSVFIPQWPVHGSYFPLHECGLTLEDIAYCNTVRCRTASDRAPNRALSARCITRFFGPWLAYLAPRVVVFIGKWAHEKGAAAVLAQGIPCAFMNRQRSLSSQERADRAEVVALVRKYRG